MKQTILTAGIRYLDIDAYASMVAYRELLRPLPDENLGKILAVSSASVNGTVPEILRFPEFVLDTKFDSANADFVLLDVSSPEHFDPIVKMERVTEVIDHHAGYEQYWQEHKDVKSQIEFIGAVCTIIFERIVAAKRTELLTPNLRKLLAAGILDNTLNLKASITTERDVIAYHELLKIGKIPENWGKTYFEACQEGILQDAKTAIFDDMKIEKSYALLPAAIGQIILLNHDALSEDKIREIFHDFDEWMLNVISLEDGKGYIYFDGDETTRLGLEKTFERPTERDGLIVLDKFMLRKEFFKQAKAAEKVVSLRSITNLASQN